MFTLEQITAAHAKVKSGADFPRYIKDLKNLGVENYVTYVSDGHTEYNGVITTDAKYELLTVAVDSNAEVFKKYLKEHQEGGSDYLTFCRQCAEVGVEKWVVRVEEMTCTYYDRRGGVLLEEGIPG